MKTTLLAVTALAMTIASSPLLNPVRAIGSYGFTFYGNGILKIESLTFQERLFSKIYLITPLDQCLTQPQCNFQVQGLLNATLPSGSVWEFLRVKFKVLTTVPPTYAVLKKYLGPIANKLFIMCTLKPDFGAAVNSVKGSIGKFLNYGMRTFYFFSIAPYGVQLRPGDTIEMVYFMSTSPTDVSLLGRRALFNNCPWGGLYLQPLPTVYNFGGIDLLQLAWGWILPNFIRPVSYWDYPKNVYITVNVNAQANYPKQGTLSPNRGPSGLISIPPLQATVTVSSYPQAVPNFKLPTTFTAAVMQSFEVGFERKCPGDVDLDGKYTMKDFEIVGCMTGVIKNKKYCDMLLSSIPPILMNLFSITGDFTQDGTVNQMDALTLLQMVGKKCPYGDYAKYIYGK